MLYYHHVTQCSESMQINPNLHNSTNYIRDVPARLLAAFADKSSVHATVVSATTTGLVQLQVGQQVIQAQTGKLLKAGDEVQLQKQQEGGKTVIKITLLEPASAPSSKATPAPTLQNGQQVAVEVIKVLTNNMMMVKPVTTAANANLAGLPAEIELDISALKTRFTVADRLMLEVLSEKPLSVALKADKLPAEMQIQQLKQQLLAQIQADSGGFNALNKLLQVSEAAKHPLLSQALEQLTASLTEKTALQQPELLKQSLLNSGNFLEKKLADALVNSSPIPRQIQQDAKANLLQFSQLLKQLIQQPQVLRALADPQVMATLPEAVQKAIIQLNNASVELRQLPAQVPAALAHSGQTPMQLLLTLLTGLRPVANDITPGDELAATKSFMLPLMAQSANSAQNSSSTPIARQVEWQLLREVLREVDALSSRIQHNQLSMVRDTDTPSNMNVWLFDLPVKDKQHFELLQLRLEQHSPEQQSGADIWQVQLNLETANLGPMQARISLQNQDVKVTLLAEKAESTELLRQHIDELNQRLDKLGVTVSQLHCRQATISPMTRDETTSGSQHLVDISV